MLLPWELAHFFCTLWNVANLIWPMISNSDYSLGLSGKVLSEVSPPFSLSCCKYYSEKNMFEERVLVKYL